VILCCLLNFLSEAKRNKKDVKSFFKLAIKSLILSSFPKIFVIPLVIWNPIDIYFKLALLFNYLSNLQAINGLNSFFINYFV